MPCKDTTKFCNQHLSSACFSTWFSSSHLSGLSQPFNLLYGRSVFARWTKLVSSIILFFFPSLSTLFQQKSSRTDFAGCFVQTDRLFCLNPFAVPLKHEVCSAALYVTKLEFCFRMAVRRLDSGWQRGRFPSSDWPDSPVAGVPHPRAAAKRKCLLHRLLPSWECPKAARRQSVRTPSGSPT